MARSRLKIKRHPEGPSRRWRGHQGASGLLIRIAKCCNPVPGDEIVGYITKGRGVAIHRQDCMNLRAQEQLRATLDRCRVEDNNTTKDYIAHIDIYGLNRAGLLNDVLQVLSNTAKMVSTVNAQPTKDMKFANIHISFGISNPVYVDNGCG